LCSRSCNRGELESVNATKKANKTLIPTRAHAFICRRDSIGANWRARNFYR